jgi:pyruvate/2-oxoglutarate/acetoin dehydrogenase E1 component
VAAEIAARIADAGFDELDAPIRRVCGAFCPTPYSPSLESQVVPSAEMVERAIRDLIEE